MRTINQTHTYTLPATGVLNGDVYEIGNQEGYSLVFSTPAGSTAAGSLTLQASNDALLDNPNVNITPDPNAVWVTVSGTTNAVASGANTFLYNMSQVYYRFFRFTYTATSGTGTATTFVAAKGPN